MHLTGAIRRVGLICAAMLAPMGATTIVSSAGNGGAVVPLGFYAPYAATGNTPIVYAVGWTQTTGYQNVDVAATLFIAGGGDTLNYTLTDAIGPGTTFAQNGIKQGSITFDLANNAIESVDLFQLPFLAAGKYYLILDSPTPNSGWSYGYPLQPSYTTDTGVTFAGNYDAAGAGINPAYTAASSFGGVNLPVQFAVTGTAAAPEPSTFIPVGGGLMAVLWGFRRALAGRRSVTRE